MDEPVSVSVVLETDFNDIDDDGLLTAWILPGGIRTRLAQGDLVQVRDVEGNGCWARVAQVREGIFLLEPLWGTWQLAQPFRIQHRNPALRLTWPTRSTGALSA